MITEDTLYKFNEEHFHQHDGSSDYNGIANATKAGGHGSQFALTFWI